MPYIFADACDVRAFLHLTKDMNERPIRFLTMITHMPEFHNQYFNGIGIIEVYIYML